MLLILIFYLHISLASDTHSPQLLFFWSLKITWLLLLKMADSLGLSWCNTYRRPSTLLITINFLSNFIPLVCLRILYFKIDHWDWHSGIDYEDMNQTNLIRKLLRKEHKRVITGTTCIFPFLLMNFLNFVLTINYIYILMSQ